MGRSGSESPARLRRMAPATEVHGLVLAHHALVQLLLQVHELRHLALHHLLHGDARPRGHDLGDLVVGHLLLQDGAVLLLHIQRLFGVVQAALQVGDAGVADLGRLHQVALARGALLFELGASRARSCSSCTFTMASFSFCHSALRLSRSLLGGGDVAAQRLQALLGGLVGLLHERLLLDLHLGELAVGRVNLLRHGVDLDAQAAGGLVHEVDGLVGQEAVGDVAVRRARPRPRWRRR